MDRVEAMRTAREWVAVRREVRAALIAAAREKTEHIVLADDKEVFKLWHYPSDLSEERLLNLIDRAAENRTELAEKDCPVAYSILSG